MRRRARVCRQPRRLIAAVNFSQSDVELMQFGTLKMMMAQQIRTEAHLEVLSNAKENERVDKNTIFEGQ